MFDVDLGWLDAVNSAFEKMWKEIYKVGAGLYKFTKGLAGFTDEAEKLPTPIDAAKEALEAFDAELKKVRTTLSKDFLKNEQAGRYATEWENAQKRVKVAADAIPILEKGLLQAESFVGPLQIAAAADLERLRLELGATQLEFKAAEAAVVAMKKTWEDSFQAISKSISDGLKLEDLNNELADFNLSELDQAIASESRRIEKTFADLTESLAEMINDPDIPDELKGGWKTALAKIPTDLEAAKAEIKRLMTDLFAQKEAKEAADELQKALDETFKETKDKLADSAKNLEDFQAAAANADTPQVLESLRQRMEELARTAGLLGQDLLDARAAWEAAFAELDAEAGIKKSLEDLAKGFTPFQMAMDAANAAWGNMGSAIDDFVETGKFAFGDLAKSIIKDIMKMILKMVVFNALKAAGTAFGIPGFAEGGNVKAGGPIMVGEKGPELFVPPSSGRIIPNNQLGKGGSGAAVSSAPITNNYITNNIQALDSRSVAQVFADNRKSLLGTVRMAENEMPY